MSENDADKKAAALARNLVPFDGTDERMRMVMAGCEGLHGFGVDTIVRVGYVSLADDWVVSEVEMYLDELVRTGYLRKSMTWNHNSLYDESCCIAHGSETTFPPAAELETMPCEDCDVWEWGEGERWVQSDYYVTAQWADLFEADRRRARRKNQSPLDRHAEAAQTLLDDAMLAAAINGPHTVQTVADAIYEALMDSLPKLLQRTEIETVNRTHGQIDSLLRQHAADLWGETPLDDRKLR